MVLAAVLAVDQATKALVRSGLAVGDEDPVLPAVTLVHTQNRGVAFSALEGRADLISVVIVLALVALVVYFARNAGRPGLWIPVGLLAGGALGNVVDRVARGAVTDFIKLPAWPAFNVADIAITLGVLGLVLVAEQSEHRDGTDRPT
jgi:signal peptidase II